MDRKVVFTDLDGTLLDPGAYDHRMSFPAVQALQKHKISIVLCSAKTRLEIQLLRRDLNINDPFVVENGSAIVIPEKYFPSIVDGKKTPEGYLLIQFGTRIETLKLKLKRALASTGVRYTLFTEMTAEKIAEDSGLTLKQAELARRREYSETVKLEGNEKIRQKTLRAILSNGLNCAFGGRYLTVTEGGSKGLAVRALKELYMWSFGNVVTYAFGDEENDVGMFQEVDKPILVQKADGEWADICVPGLVKVYGIGPKGFRKGVEEVLGIYVGED